MACLLVVDNDARILELYALFLAKRGHAVRTATSFHAARVELERERPELLLSDLELGAESGREELPLLWSEGLLPPTLVVSGFVDAGLERLFAGIPAIVGVLAKPFDFARLEREVDEALARAGERHDVIESSRPASLGPHVRPSKSAPDDDGWVEILPRGPRSGA